MPDPRAVLDLLDARRAYNADGPRRVAGDSNLIRAWSGGGRARLDAALPELAPVLVVVIVAVGDEPLGAPAWSADLAANRPDPVEKRQQLGDVAAVAAGERDLKRHAAGVGQEVVLGAGFGAVNRRGPGQSPLEERGCGLSRRPSGPVDRPGGVEPPEHLGVQARPHPGSLPLPKAPPGRPSPSSSRACAAGGATRSRCAGRRGSRSGRCGRRRRGRPVRCGGPRWQERLDHLPQLVADRDRVRHGPPPRGSVMSTVSRVRPRAPESCSETGSKRAHRTAPSAARHVARLSPPCLTRSGFLRHNHPPPLEDLALGPPDQDEGCDSGCERPRPRA